MSYPEDKQTLKPPGDEPSSGSVPHKLRGKLNMDEDPEEGGGSNAANIIGIVMLVAIVVLGGLFWTSLQHSKVADKEKAEAAAKIAAEAARADSLSKLEQERIYAARADSLKAEEAKHPKPKVPTATPGTPATPGGDAAAPPPPATKFGIDVGSFLSKDRADAEMGKLTGSTSLTARVVPKTEDGGTAYHVVIGEFTSRKDAEKKANELIVAATIREATVTKLK